MSARMAAAPTGASTLPGEVFICRACGLLYDESKGDEDGGLPPDTRFADIPEGWACRLCGVGKADFEPYLMEAQQALPRPAALARTASGARGARDDAGTVIVSAGRTGWQMAQALREQDADMPITIVTACNGDVYDKPLLSVALARGISPQMLPREAGVDAARRLKVRLLAQTHAVRVVQAAGNCEPVAAPCVTSNWCWRMAPRRGNCRSFRRHCAGASTICRLMLDFALPWLARRSALWLSARG